MSDWAPLFQRPADVEKPEVAAGWFTRIAERLLTGSRLMAGGQPHRFTEVELYYCGEGHPDPFTHRDPVQLTAGRWYFHRTRGTYRSGSFKGVDFTFGDGKNYAGVLIRGLAKPDGTLVDGPSLLVDYLLSKTGADTVAQLDKAIAERPAWDEENPLQLVPAKPEGESDLVRCGRVGLTLKRASGGGGEMPRYVLRPYRYLTEPRRIAKGKPLMVLGLHIQGLTQDAIREMTGCPKGSLQRYVEDFEAGRAEADFMPFFGQDLGPKELCKMYGTWYAVYGSPGGAIG